MKKFSKFLIISLVIVFILTLAACDKNPSNKGETFPTNPTEAVTNGNTKPSETQKPTEPEATKPSHTHQYKKSEVKATCVEDGYTLYSCSCGDSYKENHVPATGHNYTESVVPATCVKDGYTLHTCHCGDTYKSDTVSAPGHKWGKWNIVQKPTTTTEGKEEHKCSVCGETETHTLPKEKPNHEHEYIGKVTTEATCTKEGVQTFTCSCGSKYALPIEKKDHNYSIKQSTVAPTCEKDGYTVYKCKGCSATDKRDVKDKLPHDYNAATCTKPAICKNCGAQYGKEQGHRWTNATCTTPKTCVTCKITSGQALGHDYGQWSKISDTQHQKKCSRCTYIQKANHNWDSGTVTKAATCKEAGVKTFTCHDCKCTKTENIAKLSEHSWNNGTITKPATCAENGVKTYTCNVCKTTKEESIAKLTTHKYGSWTKISDTQHKRTCSGCSKYETAKHNWNSGVITKAATCKEAGVKTYTCTDCKATKTEPIAKLTTHSYGSWTSSSITQHTRKCSVCSKPETQNHNWNAGVVTKPATCQTEGIKTFTCKDCGQTRTENISTTGHSYGKWSKLNSTQHQRKCTVCSTTETANHSWDSGKISQAATCESAGSMTYTCATCGAAKKEALSAIGHNWKHVSTSNGVTTEKCSNCNKTRTVAAENHSHDSASLETMTVAKAAVKCSSLGNYSLEKYSRMTDVNIDICTKCGYVDYKSVKSIYTPQQETAKFIALAKSIRDPFIYQDSLNCGYTEEEAKESIEEYKHVSDSICINHAVRRAKEISVDYSHNGQPVNTAENIIYGGQTIGEDFQGWCNSTGHYNNMIKWAYPYVGYARYIVGDPTFETITIYSVAVFGYYSR